MIIDAISDLHGHYPQLEGGDLFIVAGDCTFDDKFKSWDKFFDWIDNQNYRKKIVVAGNHDNFCTQWAISGTFSDNEYQQLYPGENPLYDYLCDSGTEFQGLKIWGSPWTKSFEGMNPNCKAFTVDTEEELAEKWALIPDDTDVLITHSPPWGILDELNINYSLPRPDITDELFYNSLHVGSISLRNAFFRIKPKLHVFGHIHEGGGKKIDLVTSICVNASHVNERYQPVNAPIRIVL